ncbi:hypothetical protein HPB48_020959 [Haemaphysalis longicornis]|uniref:Uncharacterized protein n=1 Tax=Haemaphysalis longicornis TaxID=44386 RepID=A0A9J6FPR1_HAELO|nr:hypothetical protein HPB48_020959 [Haemaphysalis longicornis]
MCSKRGLSKEEIGALLDLSSDSGDDSEADDWEQLLTDISTSGDESEDSEPVRANGASARSSAAKASSRTSTVRKDSTAWIADKDNDCAGKPTDFLGEHKVNVPGALPIDYFLAVFPEGGWTTGLFTLFPATPDGSLKTLPKGTTEKREQEWMSPGRTPWNFTINTWEVSTSWIP